MFKYLLSFIFVVTLFSQDNSAIRLNGYLGETNGDCYAVEAHGDTVYIAEGKGFKIIDYSDKENPVLISQCILPVENISSIIIANNYAYLLSIANVMIIDISNKIQPLLLIQYETCIANNFVLKDGLLFVVYGSADGYWCYNNGCLILDVSDPDSIKEHYNYQTNYPIFDIAIKDSTAYLAVEDAVIILSIANPGSPKKVGQVAYDASFSSLYIDNDILYVVFPFSGLSVFNIEDPYKPKPVANLDEGGFKVTLHNNYLYLAQRIYGEGPDDSKIAIIDVTSPDKPVKISEINLGDFGFSYMLDYSNSYLYVSHGSSGLYVVDVLNVNDPVEVTRYKTGYKNDLAVYNNYAYVVSGYNGIQIIDITDKALPQLIGNMDFKEHPADRMKKAVIEDNILYLMINRYNSAFSIYMIDISDPLEPKILGNIKTNYMTDIAVNNKIIYLACIYDFCIIDANDPGKPHLLKTFSRGTGAGKDLQIAGNYAFIGEWKEGLRVLDISDPLNIFEAGIYDDFCIGDIYINDKIAYVIAQSHLEPEYSLRILDISDLSSIKELGHTNLNSYVKSIEYINNKVILGDGLKIIDVSDPANPVATDSTDVCSDLNKIILNDNDIYAIDGINGLYIFQYDGFSTNLNLDNHEHYTFDLHQNYPNPFNPVTIIDYTIPERDRVRLSIFNVYGQLLSNLVEKEQSAGHYTIKLDASNLASGIYFYRLQTSRHSESKKFILLK